MEHKIVNFGWHLSSSFTEGWGQPGPTGEIPCPEINSALALGARPRCRISSTILTRVKLVEEKGIITSILFYQVYHDN